MKLLMAGNQMSKWRQKQKSVKNQLIYAEEKKVPNRKILLCEIIETKNAGR